MELKLSDMLKKYRTLVKRKKMVILCKALVSKNGIRWPMIAQ